jgi:signal transduction histidine kinase
VHAGIEANLPNATHKQMTLLCGPLAPLAVRTDRTAARQILDNLISNAVKYSPHGATVHLELATVGGMGVIRVRDEGPGLSEEDQKNLFKKFSRLTARPTGGESSNGLGLAIAHRLAKALGGGIRCESTLGHGSTFIFELPLPPAGTVALPKPEALERPIVTRTASLPRTISDPREDAPVPAPSAAVAMPPPPRHRVPAPPGPLAKKS